jgi:hypothetical protein
MLIRAYHGMVRWSSPFLASPSGGRQPWAKREMAACAHYLALKLGQELQGNLLCTVAPPRP